MIRFIDFRRFCLGPRNVCTGYVAHAASSAGRHDHASPQQLRRGDALERSTRSLRDYVRPPPCPPRRGHRKLKTKKPGGADLLGLPNPVHLVVITRWERRTCTRPVINGVE